MSVVYEKQVRRSTRRRAFFGSILANAQSLSVGCSMLYYYARSESSTSTLIIIIRTMCLVFACASYALWALARYQLGRSLTFRAVADGPLVTKGLYSKFTNPIYLFGTIALVFYLLAICRPLWLLVLVVLVPMQYIRAVQERRALLKKYDDQYEEYLKGVWI